MTYKEALNQDINLSPIQARNDLERYLLREEKPIPKAVAMGMQALEKQIPIKPVESFPFYHCPKCKRSVFNTKYCPDCGQALDWSDTE